VLLGPAFEHAAQHGLGQLRLLFAQQLHGTLQQLLLCQPCRTTQWFGPGPDGAQPSSRLSLEASIA
jgi:hypothetical protein